MLSLRHITVTSRRVRVGLYPSRMYATHRDPGAFSQPRTASSLLSQTLDQKQRSTRKNDGAGPFQLGLAQPSFGQGRVKQWSELSTGGKAVRATAQTSNFVVILFGAGLTAVLVYALTSELFSRNSPTVLYNEACERIKASPRVARYFSGPLTFHNNPPSVLRPRHRNRTVASQIVLDSSGQEHMLLNFYVQAGASSTDSGSYLQWAASWAKSSLAEIPELSSEDVVAWSEERLQRGKDVAKELFRYLTGDPISRKPVAVGPSPVHEPVPKSPSEERQQGIWSNITGVFGSLRNVGRGQGSDGHVDSTSGNMWQEGEVHVDLVKDASGYFVYRYILIDIPNSRSRNPQRVFVERGEGVHENEPILRWDTQ